MSGKTFHRIDLFSNKKNYHELYEIYFQRYSKENFDRYFEFEVRASDAGIREAHYMVAWDFWHFKRNYEEAEKRLYLLYNSFCENPENTAYEIIDFLRKNQNVGYKLTKGMHELAEKIIEQGYPVSIDENGIYYWKK